MAVFNSQEDVTEMQTTCTKFIAAIDAILQAVAQYTPIQLECDKKRAEIYERRKQERKTVEASKNEIQIQQFNAEDQLMMAANGELNKKIQELRAVSIVRTGIR